jgi:hypothetical protein
LGVVLDTFIRTSPRRSPTSGWPTILELSVKPFAVSEDVSGPTAALQEMGITCQVKRPKVASGLLAILCGTLFMKPKTAWINANQHAFNLTITRWHF